MDTKELNIKNRTIRKFLDKDIPESILNDIQESVRYAHCGNNKQLLRYILVTSKEYRDKVASLVHYAALLDPSIGTPKKEEEPHAYIIICAPKPLPPLADIDIGIASQLISASACENNVGSCLIFNFNKIEMSNLFDLKDYEARLTIALGYPKIQSFIEEAKDSLVYWVDEDNNYHVPKLSKDKLWITL